MRKRWVEYRAGGRYRVKVGRRVVYAPLFSDATVTATLGEVADARAVLAAARRSDLRALDEAWLVARRLRGLAPRPPWKALETPDSTANAALRPD